MHLDRVNISNIGSLFNSVCLFVILFVAFLGFSFKAYGFEGEDETTQIRRVSFASRSNGTGLVIRLHATNPVSAYSEPHLVEDNRLELIVFNASLTESYRLDKPRNPIQDLIIQPENGHLVFNFALPEQISIEAAAYPDHASNDLLIGVTYEGELPNSESKPFTADRGNKLPEVTSEKKNQVAEPDAVEAAPVAKVSHDTPILTPKPVDESLGARWTLDTVVIDAGHGGHDPGAIAHGVKEKDVNLSVALKLGYYLERYLKLNVVYTRTEDEFVELEDRGHIANENGAKLFISLHSNSAPYSRAIRGTETYILGLHKTETALEVMERENSVVRFEENPDKYEDFYQNNIVRTLAFSANMRMSEKLAGLIEMQFAERARRQSRGVKQAGFIVLWAASMPAVLVELGYLTNRFEASYLSSEEGQDYLASAIFRAVRDFKQEYDKGLDLDNNRVAAKN